MISSSSVDDCIYLSTTIGTNVMDILKDNFPESKFVFMSSAVKFSKIAENKGISHVRLGPTYEWDTAAGQCIVEESGGVFLTRIYRDFPMVLTNNFSTAHFLYLKEIYLTIEVY